MHCQLQIRVLDNEMELNEDFAVNIIWNMRNMHVIEVAGHTGPVTVLGQGKGRDYIWDLNQYETYI